MVKRTEKFDIDDILDMLDDIDPELKEIDDDYNDIIGIPREKAWIKYRDYIIGIFIAVIIIIIIIVVIVLIKKGRQRKTRLDKK